MFIAHLPAGYLLSRGLLALPPFARLPIAQQRRLLVAGLFASILPDLDLFYLYLFAPHGQGHRGYPSHWPLLWLALSLIVALAAEACRRRDWHGFNLFVLANVQLHLLLDTVAGPVRWLAPFDHTRFVWMIVPRQPGWWVWSYVVHVSMFFEILIVVAAAWLASQTARQHSIR